MSRAEIPLLSKSRFTSGLQCLKRLYLQCYEPGLASAATPAQDALFEAGTAVGVLARDIFPGGVLIAEDYRHHDEAVERTARLIERGDRVPLYEAAFTADDIRIRVDILVPAQSGAWDLVEVKSSTSVKEQYVDDAAVQLHALEIAGIDIAHVCIAHIDRSYVYVGEAYDLHHLFAIEDVTERARARAANVPADLLAMRTALAGDGPPAIDIGAQCHHPYTCEFVMHCRASEPPVPVDELPSISAARVKALRGAGVRSILDLPVDTQLTALQERVRDAARSGLPWMSAGLGAAVSRLPTPVHFIDFETANPALPRYPGTRPFQVMPFQWSAHVLDARGHLTHAAFLATGDEDPRADFVLSLARQLAGAGTVVVYSSYEEVQLRTLRADLPHLIPALDAVLAVPRVDLLEVVRTHYYHPQFHGSFSLKSVLPAVVPTSGYSDLAIQDGGTAASQFLASLETDDPAERDRIRDALLAYCARDTEAMVLILQTLRAVRGSASGSLWHRLFASMSRLRHR